MNWLLKWTFLAWFSCHMLENVVCHWRHWSYCYAPEKCCLVCYFLVSFSTKLTSCSSCISPWPDFLIFAPDELWFTVSFQALFCWMFILEWSLPWEWSSVLTHIRKTSMIVCFLYLPVKLSLGKLKSNIWVLLIYAWSTFLCRLRSMKHS